MDEGGPPAHRRGRTLYASATRPACPLGATQVLPCLYVTSAAPSCHSVARCCGRTAFGRGIDRARVGAMLGPHLPGQRGGGRGASALCASVFGGGDWTWDRMRIRCVKDSAPSQDGWSYAFWVGHPTWYMTCWLRSRRLRRAAAPCRGHSRAASVTNPKNEKLEDGVTMRCSAVTVRPNNTHANWV